MKDGIRYRYGISIYCTMDIILFEIVLSSTNFILFAIVPEAILYTVCKRVRGLQFLRICLVYYLSGYMLLCLVFELLKVVMCCIHNLLI